MSVLIIILSVSLTGLVAFLGLDHFLSRMGVNERTSFIASVIYAIVCALLLTVASASGLFGGK